MKLLVLGGRGFNEDSHVTAAMDHLNARKTIMLVVMDDTSQGAQLQTLAWCKTNRVSWVVVPTGQSWGLIAPDGAVAWPDVEHDQNEIDAQAGKAKVWRPVRASIAAAF